MKHYTATLQDRGDTVFKVRDNNAARAADQLKEQIDKKYIQKGGKNHG